MLAAQVPDSAVVIDASMLAEGAPFRGTWAFSAGQDTVSAWRPVNPGLPPGELPSAWNGAGWFRLPIRTDSSLVGVPIGLNLRLLGPSQVYLDGVSVARFEDAATPAALATFALPDTGLHLLTVRYASPKADNLHAVGYDAGFDAIFGAPSALATRRAWLVRIGTVQQFGAAAAFLVLALLHGFLFVFYPRMRENLYFALVALFIAVITFNNYQEALFFNSPETLILIRRLWGPLALLTVLVLLRLVYTVYDDRLPRRFYILASIGVALAVWSAVDPRIGWAGPAGGRTYAYAFILILFVEMLRAVAAGVRRQRRGAYVIGLGVVMFVAAFSYPLLVILSLLPPVGVEVLLAFSIYVILGLLLSMSVYFARRFAQTNRSLEAQIGEVRRLSDQRLVQERRIQEERAQRQLLEAEYAQKLQELEEARQLQLSMLPRTLPEHADLDLAAFMQTATEVGGDYYDFAIGEDGSLTVAVGDATGHGMKAGTMVTATKSLFKAAGRETDLTRLFTRWTHALKAMNLRQLYMALMLARFENGRLRVTSAGMPPALVWRAATGVMETIVLKGMPLGSFTDFPYKVTTLTMAPGDTVLLMSDGFPELFDEAGEMLGYDRAADLFAEIAHAEPVAIIDALVAHTRRWAGYQAPRDDVTFVVLKRRDGRAQETAAPVTVSSRQSA